MARVLKTLPKNWFVLSFTCRRIFVYVVAQPVRILISFPRTERTVVYQPPVVSDAAAATAAAAARNSELPDELVAELNKDSLDVLSETVKVRV